MTRELDDLETTMFRRAREPGPPRDEAPTRDLRVGTDAIRTALPPAHTHEPPTRQLSSAELAALLRAPASEVTKELIRRPTERAHPGRWALDTRHTRHAVLALALIGVASTLGLAALRITQGREPHASPAASERVATSTTSAPPPSAHRSAARSDTRGAGAPDHAEPALTASTDAIETEPHEPASNEREPEATRPQPRTSDGLAAADALARSDVREASTLYRALAAARPSEPVYALVAQVLEQRMRAQCQARAEAGEPPCTE